MNEKLRKWICPCRPHDKPVLMYRDEFTMRLLEIAKPEEVRCTINENLEIRFQSNRVFKVHGNQIVPMVPESEVDKLDETNCM